MEQDFIFDKTLIESNTIEFFFALLYCSTKAIIFLIIYICFLNTNLDKNFCVELYTID